MTGSLIPDDDHIARYVKGTQVREDGSIDGAAIRLREKDGIDLIADMIAEVVQETHPAKGG